MVAAAPWRSLTPPGTHLYASLTRQHSEPRKFFFLFHHRWICVYTLIFSCRGKIRGGGVMAVSPSHGVHNSRSDNKLGLYLLLWKVGLNDIHARTWWTRRCTCTPPQVLHLLFLVFTTVYVEEKENGNANVGKNWSVMRIHEDAAAFWLAVRAWQ